MAYDLTLYYYLKRNVRVCYKTTIGDETRIRCPFCGDSKKDPNATRLYIANKPPFKFICFNCGVSGIVNDKFLNILNGNESSYEIATYLKQKRQEASRQGNFIGSRSKANLPYFRKKLDFSITRFSDIKKLDYLNNRLGTSITIDDVEKYKIVLNIQDFFNKNGVDINKRFTTEREKRQFIEIREKYIGFLSSDRNIIVFRNTDPNCGDKERFANIRVYLFDEDEFESTKTYNIGNKVDIYKPKHKVILTEGIIDIIGVYEHFYKGKVDESDYIFMANCGKSFQTSLEHITSLSLLDNDITIYSDSDVGMKMYNKLKRHSPELAYNNVEVLYNTIGKDFGVRKEQIKLSSKVIL